MNNYVITRKNPYPFICSYDIAMENENLESMIDQDKNPKADDFP